MTPGPERPLCGVCDHRPAEPGAMLCPVDRGALAEGLSELARGYAQLDPTPVSGQGGSARGAPGFGSRSPARDAVLVLTDPRPAAFDPDRPEQLTGILRVLSWWADRAREDGLLPRRRVVLAVDSAGYTVPSTLRTVQTEAELLVANVHALARTWWAPDMAAAVGAAVSNLRATLGELEPTIPIGECPDCGGQIRARSWGQSARCRGCGQRWTGMAELGTLGQALGDAEMDQAGIARYCDVSVSTVRTWAQRDRWRRRRQGGRTLYSLADARASQYAAWDRRHPVHGPVLPPAQGPALPPGWKLDQQDRAVRPTRVDA